jgi:DNA-binding transcriptional LysR family regulator
MPPAPTAIELRHLRYFLAVADELHYGRAAQRLGIAQPPLSRAIAKLEAELGVALFHRGGRGVALTEAGDLLVVEARSILAAVETAVAEVRLAGGGDGELRIGCPPQFPAAALRLYLDALAKRHPAGVEVSQLLSVEQKRRLRSGELDLGLVVFTGDEPGLETEPLFAGGPYVVLVPADHALAAKDVVVPREFADQTLLMLPRSIQPRLYDTVLERLDAAGFRAGEVRETGGDPRDLILATVQGTGIAVGPSWFGTEEVSQGLLVARRLEPAVPLPRVVLAWSTTAAPRVRSVLGHARDAAREVATAAPPS